MKEQSAVPSFIDTFATTPATAACTLTSFESRKGSSNCIHADEYFTDNHSTASAEQHWSNALDRRITGILASLTRCERRVGAAAELRRGKGSYKHEQNVVIKGSVHIDRFRELEGQDREGA